MMKGTRVTACDLETGEAETVVILNDYVLICDGSCVLSSATIHADGTATLVIKGSIRTALSPLVRDARLDLAYEGEE